MKKVFLYFIIILFSLSKAWAQTEEVSLQLKWWHQFQFAGYYAADIKGYYKEKGLKVNILPGSKVVSPLQQLETDKADFAVTGSEILLNYIKGSDIQVIGAIFQHSPYTIISLKSSGIHSPSDLLNKRVMLSLDQGWIQLQAMLHKEGLDPNKIMKLNHTWNNKDLINGYADAMSGYTSVEVLQLEKDGFEINALSPINYGIDFYGDVLITKSSMIKNRQSTTDAFREASFKGWVYAMANKEEMAEYILTLPGVKERGVTKHMLVQEANKMDELLVPDLVEMGHMNPGRWQHMLDVYRTFNAVPADIDLDGFIYDPEDTTTDRTFKIVSYVFMGIMAVLLLLFVYSFNMKNAVKKRTAELEQEVRRRKRNEESLQRLSDELQASNNDLKQFAYITSHNLRAPVTNMLSLVKLFNANDLSDKNASYFSKIGICTENLNTMLKDLNEILSVRTEETDSRMVLNLADELERVKASISEEISDTNTLITTDFHKAKEILYPRKNIHNIFQNLITNAIKYGKDGIPVHIDITSERVGNDTIIVFSDNGAGINLKKHGEKLFGIYQRFNSSTEGKGLGLFIVKTQVEKTGGKIEVESEENEGTRFIITLKNSDPQHAEKS